MKKIVLKTIEYCSATLIILALLLGSALTAKADDSRPLPATPYTDADTAVLSSGEKVSTTASPKGITSMGAGLLDAAAWLRGQQKTGGCFPWTPGDAACTDNTQGPSARGLLKAYGYIGEKSSLTAAIAAGNALVTNYPRKYTDGDPRFATHDPLFLEELSVVTGDAQYASFVQTNFWDKLSAGVYGESNDMDAAEFGQLVVTARSGQGIVEISPWDLSATAIAAHVAGETAIRDALMAKVLAGLDATPAAATYDMIGLAGAVWASGVTGVNLDPTAGVYASDDTTAALAARLASYQQTGGAWLYSTIADPADNTNKDLQTTAFAILALKSIDPVLYKAQIAGGAAFIRSLEQSDGQFLIYPEASSTAYGGIETHAEALSALAAVAPSAVYVDDGWASKAFAEDPDGTGPALAFGYDAFATIQEGIDAVAPGGAVSVYAGDYSEKATNRWVLDTNGPHQFGLFIGSVKSGITIQGVNPDSSPINDYTAALPKITTNATNNFGTSGIFIEGDHVKITGLEVLPNVAGDNKTFEIIGDDFTLKFSHVNIAGGGSVYFNDWRYDTASNTSYLKSYNVDSNWLDLSASIDIASGAGYSGDVSGRKILNNKFSMESDATWPGISFSGTGTGVPWFTYGIGGAIIMGNTFSGGQQYIRARGDYDNSQFDWASYFNNNSFDKAVVVGVTPPADIRTFSYTSGTYTFNNVRRVGAAIQGEVDHAQDGDTILAKAGTYLEEVTLNKTNLKLLGAGIDLSIIKGRKDAGGANTLTFGGNGGLVEGFTITRDGNTVADWSTNVKNQGVIFSQGKTGNTLQKCKVTENRNGVYMNTTQGNTVKDSIITNNRTGFQFANNVSGNTIQHNYITDNWTLGVLFNFDTADNKTTDINITENTISGNWYGDVVCRWTNCTAALNLTRNWFGSDHITYSTANSSEPGYDALIPVAFGGTSTNPGGAPNIAGPCVSLVNYEPWLMDGTDIEPSTPGFQPKAAGELQGLIDAATEGSVITLEGKSYTGGALVWKPLTIQGVPGTVITPGSPAFVIAAPDVTIQGPMILDGGGSSSPAIVVQPGADNFTLMSVEIKNWATGVKVAGSVESLKIVGNWIHDNTGDGLLVDSGVSLSGVVTVEGNLFKVNGGNGVQNNGVALLKAQYNSWGDIDGEAVASGGDGASSNVDASNPTFAEVFVDVEPDTLATVRDVNEGASFKVAVKVDAAGLYAVQYKVTFDPALLTLNSITDGPFKGGGSCTKDSATAGVVKVYCARNLPDADVSGMTQTVSELNFTAKTTMTGNGPWENTFDVVTGSDLSAGARGGVKVYMNNGGYGAYSGEPGREITDGDDGRIIIHGLANYTGFVDLQGRSNDSGAEVKVYNQAVKTGAMQLAGSTSAASGKYTTSYLSPNQLVIGQTYFMQIDRALYLPTTAIVDTMYGHSKLLSNRPLTTLLQVVLLGGDANNNDEIDIGDATCIGNNYGTANLTCTGVGATSDVNGDGSTNLLDLVLMGGNFHLTSSPWAP